MPWDLQGNGGIGANNWLGTRNAAPLIIRTENAGAAPAAGTEVMRLTPVANGRRVGIGTDTPQRKLHVEPSEIHSGGSGAGFSFGNRLVPETGLPAPFTENPANGERWVWYADGVQARLWSGTDMITVGRVSGDVVIREGDLITLSGSVDSAGGVVGDRANFSNDVRAGGDVFVSGGVRIGFVQNPQAPLHVNGNIISAHLACSSLSSGGTLQGQALRITGNVGIGVTNPTFRLDVAGQAHATSFPASSDARFKTNVKELTNVLDKLEKIRAISFEWNELYESLGRSTGRAEIGVIAQEVEAVFPELVTAWGDESYEAVDYGRLTGVLIEAVKELKAQNGALRSRIEALERTQQ